MSDCKWWCRNANRLHWSLAFVSAAFLSAISSIFQLDFWLGMAAIVAGGASATLYATGQEHKEDHKTEAMA